MPSTRPSSRPSCTRSSGTCCWPRLLVWLDNRRKIRPPGLFPLYVAGYSAFRIFEETLRIDYSVHILGMRLNFWVALIGTIGGLAWFARIQFCALARASPPGRQLLPPQRIRDLGPA